MYKILKNTIEMDDYSVQKLSNLQPPEPFEWNTVEGTELNISDCIGGKGKIEVKGNTYQKQLSGKNVWRFSNLNFLTDVAGSHNIIDENILEVTSSNNTYSNSKFKLDLPDGTYTFKLGKVTNSNANMSTKRMTLSKFINNSRTAIHHIDEGDSYTFTISNNEDEYYVLEFWASYATALVNTARFEKIQVELGSTETDFEPYCGGQPSPNPDYPQEIKVVTGNNVVKHVGKNLFDKATDIILKQTYTANGGTTQLDNSFIQTKYIRVKPNTSYILHTDTDITQITDNRLVICEYDSNYNFIRRNLATNVNTYTKVMGSNTQYVRICATTESIDTLQLEEGTTSRYEPYREEEYKLYLPSLNKNMLDTRYTKIGSVNAETGEYVYNANNLMGENYIKVEPSTTYCLSGNTKFSGIRLSEYDENKTHIKRSQSNSPAVVITTTANTHYVRWSFNYNSQPVDINLAKTLELQLELGNLRTSFIECEPLELCKIDDHEDIPFKNVVGDENYNSSLTEGAWYKKNKIIKKIYVDKDNWVSYVNANNLVYFGLPLSATPAGNNILANYFSKINSLWNLSSYVDAIQISGNLQNLLLMKKDCTTVEQLKLWLASHNLEVYYALQTPTYTQITDPTLISQLEALRKAKWYKGVNNWWTETANLEPVLKGTYRQAVNE